MDNIWVLRNTAAKSDGERSTLVRADAITFLRADDHKVVAAEVGSERTVTLVDVADGAPDGPLLPADFHVSLLNTVSEMRGAAAAGDTGERVIVAQALDGVWGWRSLAVSGPAPGRH